jgi:hypothetical protein
MGSVRRQSEKALRLSKPIAGKAFCAEHHIFVSDCERRVVPSLALRHRDIFDPA